MNWNPTTVVVGLDGSELSVAAAEVAVSIARQHDAKVVLATVVRPPEGWWGIGGAPPPPESLANAIIESRREILDQAEASLDLDGVEYETAEEVGDPAAKLAQIATDTGAGLLVVGRRGAGFMERIVLGSVADRLAHSAPCPLMIVP